MARQVPNVLNQTQRFKLANIVKEFTKEEKNQQKFVDWNDAERFFQRLLGVSVTKSNIKAALETIEQKDYPLIKVSDKPTALTNLLVRVRQLEESNEALTERLNKLEKELRG